MNRILHHRLHRTMIVMLAIMTLLFARTMLLHTHGPHDHHGHATHITALQQHHSEIHLAAMDPDVEGDDLASEIDLTTEAVVKSLKVSNPLVALLPLLTLLLLPLTLGSGNWMVRNITWADKPDTPLRPPLRAPPA